MIHRDIKPSNVLVTSHDGKPVAKVIDFGVAKAIHQPLTERTIYTNFAQLIGTPLYMSPEQAEMSGLDIDTRSDIYSLGVLLYELLTGSTPLAKKRVAAAAYDEIRRLIREEEPPKPSTRLSTSDSLASIAAQRHTEPAKLSKLVRGDLDWITMKALEKDRTRRYETANGLARDIQRYLTDEVVEARPPSTAYRLRKFARKYRAALTTAVALVLLLVAGITASTILAVRATRAEAAAREAQQAEAERAEGERRANAELAARNAELAAEQAKVQARFDMAMKAIALFHTGVSEDMLLKNPQFEELRTKLLKEAAGFYADLEKLLAGQTDARSRKALADGYFQLGELTDKIGSKTEALAVHRKALALRRELAAAKGADVETRLDVARSLNAVGGMLQQTGDRAQVLSVFQEVRDLAAALEAESPTDAVRVQLAVGHNGIAFALTDMGKPAEALDSYRKALEIYQRLPEAGQYLLPSQGPTFGLQLQAGTYMSIGQMLGETGKSAEGLQSYRKASEMLQRLANANPANTSVQRYLAECHSQMGVVLNSMGKPEEAVSQFRKTLAIFQKLADAHPAVTEFQLYLAGAHGNIALPLSKTGRPEEAMQANQKGLAIFQKLADANPTVPQYQFDLAQAHNNFGRLLARQKRFAEAFTHLDIGLAMRQKLAEADPENTAYTNRLGWSHADRGRALARSGQPSKAAADLRRAVELWAKDPALDLETRFERSRALALLASLGGDAKSGVTKAEAARFADQAVAALRDAINAGLSQLDELKEPDFDPVRGRDDFKRLLSELEARSGPKAKPED